ncbi:MAG: hypothetical protein U9O64_06455 [Campylobacterota bacterium]|nr:hypothetical protein [Campylobacterota bacterium]
MNRLKTRLGLDNNPDALAAYTLFLNTEFKQVKPKTTDRFSAIYKENIDTNHLYFGIENIPSLIYWLNR